MLYKGIYTIKRVDENDFPAIKELFWKVFNKKVPLLYLKNKYNTSYVGAKYICSIAYCKDIPVAFYGAIPQKFSNHNSNILVAHACDSYTLKAHQRQGLHYKLAQYSYQIMKENNIRFVYAFHSKNTYFSTKKLGWKEHKTLQRFHIKINTLPVGKVLNKLNCNTFYAFFLRKEVSKSAMNKLTSNNPDKFKLQFNTHFINYKNSFQNHYCIKINDCIFWFKVQAIIHIGLFYAPSEIALQKALKKFKRKAMFLGITEILFQLDSSSRMSNQLQTIAKPKTSWLVGYLDFHLDIELDNFVFSYSDLDTF